MLRWLLLFTLLSLVNACSYTRLPNPDSAVISVIEPVEQWQVVPPMEGKRFDPSGLYIENGQLLIVSDRKEFNDIYKLREVAKQTMRAEPTNASLAKVDKSKLHDFEGITLCGNDLYVVEEDTSSVIIVPKSGKTKVKKIDLSAIHKQKRFSPAYGTAGAGLEGIACDFANDRLYIANERQFRMIYVLQLSTLKVLDFFDVPSGWALPVSYKDITVYPDFTDLHFTDGFLYALVRNNHQILKIDVREKRLVAAVRFNIDEAKLYDYQLPFGMAEGLYMDSDKIYILLDNNGTPRKSQAENIDAMLFALPRPSRF